MKRESLIWLLSFLALNKKKSQDGGVGRVGRVGGKKVFLQIS